MTTASSTPALAAVAACHTLTMAMVDAASAADWASVESLDEERQCWVKDLELELRDDGDLPARLEALRALVEADGRLNTLAQEARQGTLDELRCVRGKAKASAQYHDLGARS